MIKSVKVALPIDKPKETIELCDFIIAKHTLDGASSALEGVIDMTVFAALVADAKDKRRQADLKDRAAQDKYGDASVKAGTAKGQRKDTKDTVLWYIRQIKDLLLIKHNGHEEALTEYGYNVVITQTGSRKNVRITLPRITEDLLELAADIIEYHTTLGVGSPLTPALMDMTAFETLVTDATTLLGEWTVLRGEVQALNNDAINTIGYGAGQTSTTVGTIYNMLVNIRTRLLQKHQTREEALSNWGFSVKISENSRKKGAKKISLQGTAKDKATGNLLANVLVHLVEPDIFTTTDADGKFVFYGVAVGGYTVQAHKTGYPDYEKTDVQIGTSPVTLNIEFSTVTDIVKQGDLGGGNTTNIDPGEIEETGTSAIEGEATSASFQVYAAANVTDPPGAVFITINPGTLYTASPAAFRLAIGLDASKPLILIRCIGPATGHWKITFKDFTVG